MRYIVFFAILITTLSVHAKEADLLPSVQSKRAVISGVLNPASLSFNGEEIYQGNESFAGLLLNDKRVETKEVSGLQTFYLNIEDSSIDLKWEKSDHETKPILKIDYPSLTELKFNRNKLNLKFNSFTSVARLDSIELPLKDQKTDFKIENVNTWMDEIHTLELTSPKKTSQLYNLDFKSFKNELLSYTSWIFYSGESTIPANKTADSYGIGYRKQNENRRSLEYSIHYGEVSYDLPDYSGSGFYNSAWQSGLEFRFRYGWNPFYTNLGEFSFKRVTIGLQTNLVNYKRRSNTTTSFDSFYTEQVNVVYAMGGLNIRLEPLQYDRFSFIFNLDFNMFRTLNLNRGDMDKVLLGFAYNL